MEQQANQDSSSGVEKPGDIYFEKLTPNSKIDISNYESALDFALIKSENQDITNIAMTGLYGSGKSSVLRTYEDKKGNKLTFLNISLAHYQGAGGMETKNLEGKIVNQLLHQIDYRKIPQTIFKIKDNTSRKASWIYSFGIILLLGLVYGWINLRSLVRVLKSTIKVTSFDSFINSSWFGILWFVCMGILATFLLYKLIKIQIDKRPLKSLKIGGNQIEILEQSKESYFDKFMNDVIYLFVNSGADVIVFEDLDRFDDQTIYEKLREINILANKRRESLTKGTFGKKPINKKLSFLYLIKDDMFKSKDRTKFFDFIIPIVPVMDSSNSYQKFLGVFDNLEIKEDFQDKLLKKLALYIDDYRLLKNVANEYLIYKKRIQSKGVPLDGDKLLALMIYKNIFPRDFSALQYGKSYLNAIFSKKETLIQETTLGLENELEDLQKNIKAVQTEQLISLDELDAIYLKNLPNNIRVNGKQEQDFKNRAFFIAAIKEVGFKVSTNVYNQNYDMRNNFDALNKDVEYSARRKNIENKSSTKNKDLLRKKNLLESRLDKIRVMSIKDLLASKGPEFFEKVVNDGAKELDEKHEEKSVFEYLLHSDYFDLLLVLVRDELIDEKYSDYMTYFYEGTLSRNDKEFVRGILDHKKSDENYIPDNCEEILSNIQINEFMRYHIKNISISSWILSNREKYRGYWNPLLSDLKEWDTKFIYQVYLTSKNQGIHFFEVMKEDWPDIVVNIINAEDLDDYEKLQFVADYLILSDHRTINDLTNLEQLTFYVGQSKILSSGIMPEEDILKRLPELGKLGVEFTNLSDDNVSQKIIREITKLQLFAMTKENIKSILGAFNHDISLEAFSSYNYTAIAHIEDEEITKALFGRRFNQYFQVYLDFGSKNLSDESEDVVKVLNSDNLEQDTKLRYIERLQLEPKLKSVSSINEKKLWWKLANNISATDSNIISLLEYNEWVLREEVVLLINSASGLIEFNSSELEEENSSHIFNAIIIDEAIKPDQYISILNSLQRFFSDGILSSIPASRMKLLIDGHIIKFTEKNLISIRADHSANLVYFVLVNFDEYIKTIENDEYFDNNELINLLQSDKFSISQSKKIIDKMQYPLSIKKYNYKDPIKRYILENKFDVEDIEYLTSNYDTLRKAVEEMAYRRISDDVGLTEIISNSLSLQKKLLDKLLLDADVQINYKQHIFVINIFNLSEVETVKWVYKLSLPVAFVDVLQRRKIRIDNTELHLEIAKQYKNRNWISKVEENGDELILQGRKILDKQD